MANLTSAFVHLVSEGGIAATHAPAEDTAFLAAPSTGSEFNTIASPIIPVACWRVEDIRFEFDSSIVQPEMRHELRHLAELARQHPPPSRTAPEPGFPLSIFGHADPTGNDEYNKQLSGRRAKAVYALVTRQPELWEQLYSQPYGNDTWGRRSLQTMLTAIGTSGSSGDVVGEHERNRGKRSTLFSAYMDHLCGPDLKLAKGDFLAAGQDAGGKGDYQGCSEFNPVKVFSQEQLRKFDQSGDKTERNARNAPNRRVVALFFRRGSRVSPSRWPCPRAAEGIAGCQKRFWSDAARRRAPSAETRTVETARDTFACRFYDRLTFHSPCDHSNVTGVAPIVLDDPLFGPARDVVVTFRYEDGLQEPAKTNARGVAMAKTTHGAFVDITYDRHGVVGEGRVFLLPPPIGTETGVWQRLANLGYTGTDYPPAKPPTPEHLALAVEEFQSEFGAKPNGQLDDATRELIAHAHDTDGREWKDRDWQGDVEVPPNATESKAKFT